MFDVREIRMGVKTTLMVEGFGVRSQNSSDYVEIIMGSNQVGMFLHGDIL
jgi:hypothetical protein